MSLRHSGGRGTPPGASQRGLTSGVVPERKEEKQGHRDKRAVLESWQETRRTRFPEARGFIQRILSIC